MSDRSSLKGQVAIITGAASGIGLATALVFLESDIKGVTLVDLSLESLETAQSTTLSQFSSDRILLHPCDVTLPQSSTSYVEATLARFNRFDISIQCAGICPPAKPFLETKVEEFDRVMDVNVRAVWLGCQSSIKGMIESEEQRREGEEESVKSIVLVSSQIGLDGMPSISPYSTSKFALRGLMSSLSQEFSPPPRSIRINSICPGPISTPLYDDFPDKETHEGKSSLKRAGTSKEVAEGILYLSGKMSSFVTGTTLKVDGGWSKWC